MTMALAQTPLHALHLEHRARMVPFAGYEMPLEYPAGQRAEHAWTRTSAGLFDVSHMGQVRVRGRGIFQALERMLPVDFDSWPIGLQKYSLLLSERGTIEDDLMVTRLAEEVAIVVNAACRGPDLARFRQLCPELEFSIVDRALLALQGPKAPEVLREAAGLRFMHAEELTIQGVPCFVARSGYTGEDGFEVSVAAEHATSLARLLLAHPAVKLIGLGARDTLRMEAGLPLYGQDIDQNTTPQEAGLEWALARSRRATGSKAGGFPGAAGAQQARRRFAGFVGTDPVPVRSGAELIDATGAVVGRITSGTVSPTLSKSVMLGYLDLTTPENTNLRALVRGKPHPVEMLPLPFVTKRYKR